MKLKSKFYDYFPALTHRNFRLFLSGQIISLIGTWMQNAALSWLVYSLTEDKFKLGLMNAVQFTPLFLFSLYSGVIVEKYSKRKLIIFTQSLQLIAATLLFILVYFKLIKYEHILIIMFGVGMVQALDNPARQSFVVEMVEGRKHLLNAIALNSATFNAARLVGPSVAGWIMSGLGEQWCFFLNAVSFVAVLAGLFMMRMEDKPTRTEVKNHTKDIVEGIKYIGKTPKLLYTFIAVAIIPTFTMNFNILIPILTRDVLGLEEAAYGTLLSAVGLGALVGALSVAAKAKKERAVIYQMTGAFGLSLFLLLMRFVRNYYLALGLLVLCGFFMIMFNTTSNSVLQFNSPDTMRGRIMSVYTLVFGGLTPIGSLYAGSISKKFGVDNTFMISGLIGFTGFMILFLRRRELK
ncbi:MFS transporter [Fonticella tunisiensis]|uniref:MFS-type transporter involved in bile tolerance (Atg22 family) n=1 Tax=Fonticella tunisiensis TaxID=1096341 RepID=A0A4R7KSI0_9CLOT|nr:MFS transporter [Fonticella tunisiensis]TDT61052.1 MFS-type transporter involved in bile tolerance (Atg22 family) [Fonticella tunisiensis]